MKPIKIIYSENPYQKMWDTFVFFESEPTTKQFLMEIYYRNSLADSHKLAFQNTSKLIYFIKQAKEYFFSAEKSNILVKPLLVYYGMMSLVKAVILTKDPNYPSRTGVLRHGITTRKLKKTNFKFHEDEVKIQKEGLFPWFYSIMTNKPIEKIEGNKYKIQELISVIPELHESYTRLFKEKIIYPISIQPLDPFTMELNIPKEVLKNFSGEVNKLLRELNGYSNHKGSNTQFSKNKTNNVNSLSIIWNSESEIITNQTNYFNQPSIIQDFKGKYYIRPIKDSRLLLPDIMIDFMLMYNLGMLCRYDTELWGEIIFSFVSEDMYIINELVNLTIRKFPNLILNALFDEFLIFESN